jgi:predicted methyltransferase MtxX (methanogen marker protein 4)
VEADLDLADRSVAIESWWWAGDLGATFGVDRWIGRAEAVAARILRETDSSTTGFERYARRLIDAWRR